VEQSTLGRVVGPDFQWGGKLKLGAIFVSYRRSDAQGEAGRLFDDLVKHFGDQMVFMDVAGIEAGRDFRKAIEESVAKCGVLLVVMGPEWLNAKCVVYSPHACKGRGALALAL
jgi:hypothetical protein